MGAQASSFCLLDRVLDGSENIAFVAQLRLQKISFLHGAIAFGRAGHDDLASFEGHVFGDVGELIEDLEIHVASVVLLDDSLIDFQFEFHVVGVADRFRGDEIAQGQETVLSLHKIVIAL